MKNQKFFFSVVAVAVVVFFVFCFVVVKKQFFATVVSHGGVVATAVNQSNSLVGQHGIVGRRNLIVALDNRETVEVDRQVIAAV
ncbi:MAG TPA: hypothetical protein VI306_05665 [Pyrinomonadaceae bacterium]